jgi:hypothetical protein
MPKTEFRFKPFRHRPGDPASHGKPEGVDLTESDIGQQLDGDKVSALFLGSFELELIQRALDRFGITQQLRGLGYSPLAIHFRPHGSFEHYLTIRDGSHPDQPQIGEIVLKESRSVPTVQPVPEFRLPSLSLLSIEWILMQHIRGRFTPERRRLPGQNYPGLGIGNQVVALLSWVAKIMHKDGLMNVPEYFHNAIFYSKWFNFIDPRIQGDMEAIYEQLTAKGRDICDISFAAFFDCLVEEKTGAPLPWRPHEQIMPISQTLEDYFAHPTYERLVEERRASLSIGLDLAKFTEHMATVDQLEW